MTEYDINQAFIKIENDLISSMMRNMERHKAEETEYGFNWSAWQAEQLKGLERYHIGNVDKFGNKFGEINRSLDTLIREARTAGGMKEEIKILKNIQKSYKVDGKNRPATPRKSNVNSEFFKSNDKKMDALIRATKHDLENAETAMLRRANDQYRKIIFNAQVYANSGAATYKKAVDMAAKDFLRAGIDCIEYKNGARHTISDYASMAIRTANQRAALTGAGEKRNEWGIHTVIVNNRAAPCELCLPFVGVVFIDDVWSGGSRKDGDYPLLSTAISAGLFHPNCQDGTSTYYPGITPLKSKYTKADINEIAENAKLEKRINYASNQANKFKRLGKYALDSDSKKLYESKAKMWENESDLSDKIKQSLSFKRQVKGFAKEVSKIKEDDLRSALYKSLSRTEIKRSKNKRSYFSYNTGVLHLSPSASSGTLAHELFHEIDNRYEICSSGGLTETIKMDYRKIQRLSQGYGKSIEHMLYSRYPNAFYKTEIGKISVYEEYRGISDILHGMTDGDVFLGYGHKQNGYWDKKLALERETFAQFGRMFFEKDEEAIKMARDLFPETYKNISRTIKGVK